MSRLQESACWYPSDSAGGMALSRSVGPPDRHRFTSSI